MSTAGAWQGWTWDPGRPAALARAGGGRALTVPLSLSPPSLMGAGVWPPVSCARSPGEGPCAELKDAPGRVGLGGGPAQDSLLYPAKAQSAP